ncbi:MAG: tetratricopeptide repeat protein [Gemmatimonadota bacterium]|nr:tetratricopeptide repeat protein [Gemmatimonadota bacterium]
MASSARIDELKKKFDENPRRYFAPLANEYRKAGDPDQAIAICREFLPQQPGHMSGHIVYGQALFDAGQFEEARTVFDTALTLDPENLIALRSLGDIARNLGDPATAGAWYQRVLDADPRNEDAAAALTALREGGAATDTVPEAAPAPAPAPETAAPAPQAAAEPSEPPVAEESAGPQPRVSETLILGATPLDETPAGEAAEPPSEPAPEPVEGIVTGPAAALEMAVPAPPAEERLDLGDLGVETETPVVPRISTPHTTLAEMGVDVDRSDDDSFLPSLHGTPAAPEAAEAPEAAPEAAAPAGEPQAGHDPFATETMAELYLSQGHPEEAIRVYRQLIAQRGGDARLEARIAHIEAMTALTPAMPMQAIPEPPMAAPEPAPEPRHEPEAALDLELEIPGAGTAAEPEPEAPQQVPDLDTSGFSLDGEAAVATPTPASAPEAVSEPEPAPIMEAETEPEAVPAPAAGPSIREFRSLFALRVRAGSSAPQPPAEEPPSAMYAEVATEAVAVEVMEPPVAVETPPAQPATRGGSIDSLFGDMRVATPEESAAATLAGAYGVAAPEPEAPPIAGAPARRATEELSLDNVFREPQAAPPAEPTGFSFDQFFAGGTPTRGAVPVRETPVESQPPESADADIEQFNSWLEGLKKR